MNTPERSVEEYEQKLAYFLYSFPLDQRKRLTILNMHTEALQAERKKRDEMVEAERERIMNIITPPELNGMLTVGNCVHGSLSGLCGKCSQDKLLKIEEALTHPNNNT